MKTKEEILEDCGLPPIPDRSDSPPMYYESILKAMETYASQFKQRWIPVSEKLPEFDEMVLVCCAIYGRFMATYEFVGDFYGVAYGNWRNSSTGEFGILPPTHWTPLLEPPKTENA